MKRDGRGRSALRPLQDLALGILVLVTVAGVVAALHPKRPPKASASIGGQVIAPHPSPSATKALPTLARGTSLALARAVDPTQLSTPADSAGFEIWGSVFGAPDKLGVRRSVSTTKPTPPFGLRFSVTSASVDVVLVDVSNALVRVDGVAIKPEGLQSLAGGKEVLKIGLGPKATRLIEVIAEGGGFAGVTLPAGATLNAQPTDDRKRVLFLGDELSTSIGAGPSWLAAGWAAAEARGFQPWLDGERRAGCSTIGATGFGVSARIVSDVAPAKPDLVIVTCGGRDATTGADPTPGLTKILDGLGAILPRAKVAVIGPIASPGGGTSAEKRVRDQMKALVAGRSILAFVDPIAAGWTPASGGIGGNGTSLTALGHAQISKRLAVIS